MKLYPQLPQRYAGPLAKALSALPVREVERQATLSHRYTIRTPTGGTAATENDLRALQTALRRLAAAHGYVYGEEDPPPPLADTAAFDLDLARILDEHLLLELNEAARGGIWAFLGCCLAPELVRWRFPGTEKKPVSNVRRFEGKRHRNLFARMWWRAQLLKDPEAPSPYWIIGFYKEDRQVQIMERTSLSGWRPMNVAIARQLHDLKDQREDIPEEWLFRDAMKRLLRRAGILCFEALDDDGLAATVREMFTDSLRARGVEIDSPAPTWDPQVRWEGTARSRRAAFMAALDDAGLDALDGLMDRSRSEWAEYEAVWRGHFQLTGTVGEILDIVVPKADDLPQTKNALGQWLTELPAGTWSTEVLPQHGERFLRALRDEDARAIFQTSGWEWGDSTHSAALRKIRREYSGSWRALLSALPPDTILRLRTWFPVAASDDPEDVRLSLARWLVDDPDATLEAIPEVDECQRTQPGEPDGQPAQPVEVSRKYVAPDDIHPAKAPKGPCDERPSAPTVEPAQAADEHEVPDAFSEPGVSEAPPSELSDEEPAEPVPPEPDTVSPILTDVPGMIANVLLNAGVRTIADLRALEPETLIAQPGVGRKKVELIREFQRDALTGHEGPVEVGPETAVMTVARIPRTVATILSKARVTTLRELFELDMMAVLTLKGVGGGRANDVVEFRNKLLERFPGLAPKRAALPDEVSNKPLTVVPPVLQTLMAQAGLDTVGDLANADPMALASLQGVGVTKLQAFRDFREATLAAAAAPPPSWASVAELADDMLTSLSDDHVELIRWRFEDALTFAEMARRRELSRERIRQILLDVLRRLNLAYAPAAKHLLDQELGLGLSDGRVLPIVDPPGPFVCRLVAHTMTAYPWSEESGVLWNGPSADLLSAKARVAGLLQGSMHIDAQQVVDLASSAQMTPHTFKLLAIALIGWVVEQDGLSFPPDQLQRRDWLVWRMREHGGPAHQNEVGGWIMEREQIAVDSRQQNEARYGRIAEATMDRTPVMYRYAQGTFVHEMHLGVRPERLAVMVDWCASRMEGRTSPIGVTTLLNELASAGFEAEQVTPHVLKDALSRDERILPLRKGNVACASSFEESGVGLVHRIVAVLSDAGRPMSVQEVMDGLDPELDYAITSVRQALTGPEFASVGRECWVLADYRSAN